MRFWGIRLVSILVAVGVCLLAQSISGHWSDYAQRIVILVGLYVTLAVSLNLINGITGQFSIGHAAFYQVGAYLAAYLTVTYFGKQPIHNLTLWVLIMMVVGAAGAALAGLIVGLPSLRLRGDYLAIVTLGFGEIIRIIVQNQPGDRRLLRHDGAAKVHVRSFGVASRHPLHRGLPQPAQDRARPAFPLRSRGRDRQLGHGGERDKSQGHGLHAGLRVRRGAGALLAHFEGFITPTMFGMDVCFIILTMVVLGGTGSITGSVVAATFLSYLPEYLRGLKGGTDKPWNCPLLRSSPGSSR